MSGALPSDVYRDYDRLTQGTGVHDISGRTQVEITGSDRATLLHGLCTNSITNLAPGSGCEAFLTNVQGRTIGYVYVFCGEDSLILETASGQAEAILAGLDKYIIREDVQLHDRSSAWGEILLSGRDAEPLLAQVLSVEVTEPMLCHAQARFAGHAVSARRVPFLHPTCFFLACPREAVDALADGLEAAGARRCGATAVEIARIEAGSPLYGQDVSETNLPQEIDRNELAISFTKGCYLGQETVARLDSRGHVNRILRGLKFGDETVPDAGEKLLDGERVVAELTSAAWSCRLGAPLALAYVRRGSDRIGQQIASTFGEAEVIRLPCG